MKASDLKGRAVVTLNDATKVGHIDDVLFDAAYRRVLGFRVKKGTFGRAEALPRASVSAVGRDAVTAAGPDALNAEDRFAELAEAAALSQARGTKVVTEGGDFLGTIAEVDVDDEARAVTAYTLSASLLKRIQHHEPAIEADEVLRLGEGGIMIVPDAVGERLRHDEA